MTKKNYSTKRVTISMSDMAYRKIVKKANDIGLSISAFVTMSILKGEN